MFCWSIFSSDTSQCQNWDSNCTQISPLVSRVMSVGCCQGSGLSIEVVAVLCWINKPPDINTKHVMLIADKHSAASCSEDSSCPNRDAAHHGPAHKHCDGGCQQHSTQLSWVEGETEKALFRKLHHIARIWTFSWGSDAFSVLNLTNNTTMELHILCSHRSVAFGIQRNRCGGIVCKHNNLKLIPLWNCNKDWQAEA